jgi:PST family polysaccharide transporter
VVFTIQVIWLVMLLPVLIAGAHVAGINGVGLAQVAVAALLVLPLYLRELVQVGISARSVLARITPPALFAAGIGLIAALAGQVISLDLLALAVAGSVTLAVLGVLARRMRATVAELRMTGRADAA